MLDVDKRVKVIECLLEKDTRESLIYAALEGRLTLEYLCYERFKLVNPYISANDLKGWSPKDIVKQVAGEVNEFAAAEISIAISPDTPDTNGAPTKVDYEALSFTNIGKQSELNLNKIHKFWHSLSNVALHIPVPTIASGSFDIYGEPEKIRDKILDLIDFLKRLDGNLIFGGHLGLSYSFDCYVCETTITKPAEFLSTSRSVSCVQPTCKESYLVEPDSDGKYNVTRLVLKFQCTQCSQSLEVPSRNFNELRFYQSLNLKCGECGCVKTVKMFPIEQAPAG